MPIEPRGRCGVQRRVLLMLLREEIEQGQELAFDHVVVAGVPATLVRKSRAEIEERWRRIIYGAPIIGTPLESYFSPMICDLFNNDVKGTESDEFLFREYVRFMMFAESN